MTNLASIPSLISLPRPTTFDLVAAQAGYNKSVQGAIDDIFSVLKQRWPAMMTRTWGGQSTDGMTPAQRLTGLGTSAKTVWDLSSLVGQTLLTACALTGHTNAAALMPSVPTNVTVSFNPDGSAAVTGG